MRAAIAFVTLVAITTVACKGRSPRTGERLPAPMATTFEMRDAWLRTADSGATTAAYMTLINGTVATVVVHGFASDAAKTVELHESVSDSRGETGMKLGDSLVIAPGDSVVMKPGSYHLMLIDALSAIKAGRLVRISMKLGSAQIVSTTARVRAN